jgi:hypothetical protein
VNGHGYVRVIFDEVQQSQTRKVLTYLVANMTRWTTHSVAFLRIEDLKDSLQLAAYSRKADIIAAQVGKETGSKGAELRAEAEEYVNLIRNEDFWERLRTLNDDIEPICFATNIMQSNRARPDVVLLAFVGMFLYFRNLPASRQRLSKDMCTRLEKRWKGFDQKFLITALILNPYEGVSCFGPKAGVDILQLDTLLIEVCDSIHQIRELEHVPPNAVYGLSVVCTWAAVVYYGFLPISFSAQFPLTIHGENNLIEIVSYFEPGIIEDIAGKYNT